jgi:hypothetical protein
MRAKLTELDEMIMVRQSTLNDEVYKFYEEMGIVTYLCYIQMLFFIQDILEIIGAVNIGRHFPLGTFPQIIHLAIAVSGAILIWRYEEFYSDGLRDSMTLDEKKERVLVNLSEDMDFKFQYLLAVQIACLFLKVGYIMQFNDQLGPLYKIVGKMTKDFLNFLIIYAILIIMFSIVGNLLFIIEIPDHYGSLFESILTIFDASLGNYSFAVFEGKYISDRTEAIGKVYLFIVVLLFNILVLNLIIAILSNTFNMFEPKSKGLYLSKILSVRPTMSYDESYGALLIGLPPFNFHLMMMTPVFLFMDRPTKLNSALVAI